MLRSAELIFKIFLTSDLIVLDTVLKFISYLYYNIQFLSRNSFMVIDIEAPPS